MDTLFTLMTRFTTIAALVWVTQAVPAKEAFGATLTRSQAKTEAPKQNSQMDTKLADYQPPPDTGKPKESSGAGGRS